MPTPLWLDCDPGHDDAFAILLAAHHPDLKLLGVSTVHGNASLENTTINAGSILEAIGRSDIPVYPGAKKPFCRAAVHADNIHGASGIDGTDLLPAPTKAPILEPNAIVAMRNALLAQPKNTAWVVATGALTNIGLLFATFPEVAEHIKGLSIMGGSVGGGFSGAAIDKKDGQEERVGNTTPWAEFNIYCDPEAAQSIFSSPVLAPKTTLVALDLTHQVLATAEVQARILSQPIQNGNGVAKAEGQPTVLRRILHALLMFFANTYDNVFGIDEGPPLHDPLAVAVLLSKINPTSDSTTDAELKFDDGDGQRYSVHVVTDGQHGKDEKLNGEVGRTVVTTIEPSSGSGGVAVPKGVDTAKFWDIILDCIQRADDLNASRSAMN